MATVVFDLDGTLADTSGDLIAAANTEFREGGHGNLLDPSRDQRVAFRGGRAMLRLGFNRLGKTDAEAQVDALYPALLAAYAAALDDRTHLYPGVPTALAALRDAGYRLAVCTNKPEALAVALIGRLGLGAQLSALVGADTLPVRKPDPAPLREAVRRAGGDPARALLVGDTETDRNTARAAGIPCALVTFGPDGRDVGDLAPEALLDHYDALAPIVAELLGPPDRD